VSAGLERTFIEELDLRKQEQEYKLELARIKASAEVEIAKQDTKQRRMDLWRLSILPQIERAACALLIVGAILGAGWGIYAMVTGGPPKTVEQIQVEKKHERFEKCVYSNGQDDGKHDNIWYPNAANGDGLCLPKDKEPPK
jgi:hypothetical protein